MAVLVHGIALVGSGPIFLSCWCLAVKERHLLRTCHLSGPKVLSQSWRGRTFTQCGGCANPWTLKVWKHQNGKNLGISRPNSMADIFDRENLPHKISPLSNCQRVISCRLPVFTTNLLKTSVNLKHKCCQCSMRELAQHKSLGHVRSAKPKECPLWKVCFYNLLGPICESFVHHQRIPQPLTAWFTCCLWPMHLQACFVTSIEELASTASIMETLNSANMCWSFCCLVCREHVGCTRLAFKAEPQQIKDVAVLWPWQHGSLKLRGYLYAWTHYILMIHEEIPKSRNKNTIRRQRLSNGLLSRRASSDAEHSIGASKSQCDTSCTMSVYLYPVSGNPMLRSRNILKHKSCESIHFWLLESNCQKKIKENCWNLHTAQTWPSL